MASAANAEIDVHMYSAEAYISSRLKDPSPSSVHKVIVNADAPLPEEDLCVPSECNCTRHPHLHLTFLLFDLGRSRVLDFHGSLF